MNFADAFSMPIGTLSPSGELNYATTAFELPDILTDWRTAQYLSPISEEAGAEANEGILNDAFFLDEEPPLSQIESLHTTVRQLKIENSILAEAHTRQKTRAEVAEADLARLRDRANKLEYQFNRVRGRALDVILSLTEEVNKANAKAKQTFKETVGSRVSSMNHSRPNLARTFKETVEARIASMGRDI
jgi:hypothetical protein